MENVMNKKIKSILAFLVIGILSSGPVLAKNVRVKGHITKKGSYVPPHNRTSPDSSSGNNWSTKGNSNPYTGKKGTKNPK